MNSDISFQLLRQRVGTCELRRTAAWTICFLRERIPGTASQDASLGLPTHTPVLNTTPGGQCSFKAF